MYLRIPDETTVNSLWSTGKNQSSAVELCIGLIGPNATRDPQGELSAHNRMYNGTPSKKEPEKKTKDGCGHRFHPDVRLKGLDMGLKID